MSKYVVAALYKFVDFPDFTEYREALFDLCVENEVKGTLLLAAEGINGTIAGPEKGIENVLSFLRDDKRFEDVEVKFSIDDSQPFLRTKIRLKKEIVTLGKPEANPLEVVGEYVSPEEWNDLINDPEVTLIDTRNDYEVELGTFEGAINPDIQTFRDFPEYVEKNLDPEKHKKVAMFCTGGIRCEKASAYMLRHGFENVYHLKGGILKYLEDVEKENSKWEGECFVFDQRVSVNHDLDRGNYELCWSCRMPINEEDKKSPMYEEGVACPHCAESLEEERKERLRERKRQIDLAREKNIPHIGVPTKEQIRLKQLRREKERQEKASAGDS